VFSTIIINHHAFAVNNAISRIILEQLALNTLDIGITGPVIKITKEKIILSGVMYYLRFSIKYE
jgi:hypothetical protein